MPDPTPTSARVARADRPIALVVAFGGVAAGCVTGLAPALVTMAAGEQEQGDALALSGTFRSVALLGAPALVGASLSIVALPVGITTLAAASALPGVLLALRRSSRRGARPAESGP